jgi:hypothetical protein
MHAVDLFWGIKGPAIGSVSAPHPTISAGPRLLGKLSVVASVGLVTLNLSLRLADLAIQPVLLAIAILGLTLPWAIIGLMQLIDNNRRESIE